MVKGPDQFAVGKIVSFDSAEWASNTSTASQVGYLTTDAWDDRPSVGRPCLQQGEEVE